MKIAPGIISDIIASYLSTKWTLKKIYSEKWWERKSIAYSELIDALYESLQFFEIYKKDYGEGTGLSDKQETKLHEKYNQAYWKIKRATDIGAFVISQETQLILKELSERQILKWDENPKFEIYEEEYDAHRNALEKIVESTKRDLKVNGI